MRSAHANRHAEARVSRCMNTRHTEGQVDVEINCRKVPKDCPEEKEGSFQVLICPDQFIQDIEVGFWGLTSRFLTSETVSELGLSDRSRCQFVDPRLVTIVYLVLVLLCENLVVVLVVVCRSLLSQMPPASPIEDRGTAIPIEDRDRAIPERLHLCGVIVKEPRGGSSSSLQVIASSNGTTKPVVPPASPIEDRGTAIPIEDRDRAIPERLHLCGVIVKGLPVSLMWRKNDSVGP
ncbi:hypothetical protein DY000_02000859 [Brassica cretica]|uniref:Uncharacterized protein n=1 Tax=Brassica cretica TaxID=69181 RepID=A0ABQ7C6K1_BRACR|nr:hypothetical protein DY000_02000859 [Brassica cretica]